MYFVEMAKNERDGEVASENNTFKLIKNILENFFKANPEEEPKVFITSFLDKTTDLTNYLGKEITVYLENNSKLDPIFQKAEEIEYIFSENPQAEFLIDIAHMDSYEHLKALVNIKYPKILHLTDKRFSEIHEHLPVGQGEIDFEKVFKEILKDFEGRIIFEVYQTIDIA